MAVVFQEGESDAVRSLDDVTKYSCTRFIGQSKSWARLDSGGVKSGFPLFLGRVAESTCTKVYRWEGVRGTSPEA